MIHYRGINKPVGGTLRYLDRTTAWVRIPTAVLMLQNISHDHTSTSCTDLWTYFTYPFVDRLVGSSPDGKALISRRRCGIPQGEWCLNVLSQSFGECLTMEARQRIDCRPCHRRLIWKSFTLSPRLCFTRVRCSIATGAITVFLRPDPPAYVLIMMSDSCCPQDHDPSGAVVDSSSRSSSPTCAPLLSWSCLLQMPMFTVSCALTS